MDSILTHASSQLQTVSDNHNRLPNHPDIPRSSSFKYKRRGSHSSVESTGNSSNTNNTGGESSFLNNSIKTSTAIASHDGSSYISNHEVDYDNSSSSITADVKTGSPETTEIPLGLEDRLLTTTTDSLESTSTTKDVSGSNATRKFRDTGLEISIDPTEGVSKRLTGSDPYPSANGVLNDGVEPCFSRQSPRPVRTSHSKIPTIPTPAIASTSTDTSVPLSFNSKSPCCNVDDRNAADLILHVTRKGDSNRYHSPSTGSLSQSSSFSISKKLISHKCSHKCYSKIVRNNRGVFNSCGCTREKVAGDKVNFLDCLCTGTPELEEDLQYTGQLCGQDDSHSIWSASNEENELLSAGAIKMSERPFSRSESRTTDSDDDDLIEDYDVTIFNPQCVRNRSGLEKFLAVVLVLFLVVIIALAVALVKSKEPPSDPYCSTPACISAAGSILTSMDTTVDPCHNFYQYACGSWVRDNPIPENYVSWDRFQELSEKNLYRLKGLLESLALMGPVEQKVRNFYNSCLLESDGFHQDIRKKTLSSLRLLIRQVGGWSFSDRENATTTPSSTTGSSASSPTTTSSTSSTTTTTTSTTTTTTTAANWRFQTALQNIHRLGVWPLFEITVDVDEMDPTKNIFKIGIGSNFMDPHIHPMPSKPENGTTLNGPLYSQFLSESFEKYMKETIRIMKLLAGKFVNVSLLAYRVSLMEKTLIQMKSKSSQESYNVSTIHDLTVRYPMINWMQYFTSLASIRHLTIKSTDRVAILYPDYLSHLSVFLNDVKTNSTKAETLRNYLIVSLIRSMLPFFEESNLEEEEKDSRKPLDSWKRCVFYTNKALGFATGAIYVRAAAKGKLIHDKIESLIKYIKEAFKAYILRKFWMDKHTKAAAAAKLDSMIEKVSYPSFMLNTTYLNNYYKKFNVVEGNWFTNLIRWKKFDLERMIGQLIEKPDRRRWISPPVTVSPFYSPIRNELFFPMALFHLPFFSEEGPQALNFGAIGSVIGHEITHAFGVRGMHYDGKGQLRNWWDPETAKKFNITTQCVRRTYSSYKVENLNVNGDMTLDENIADNGGLRAAYVAYLLWTEEHGEEKPLPGIDLSPTQLFYVSFAQMYCSAWTKEGIWHQILSDHFAPGKARVIGAISNSRAFSSVFDCPFMSEMNPSTKCEVW